MNEFKFSYDEANDDLFIYLEGKKSKGAVEIGSFILDFDADKNLVAIQILNASDLLSKLISKIITINNIKKIRANIINFRNMEAIQLEVDLGEETQTVQIIIPRIKTESPALLH